MKLCHFVTKFWTQNSSWSNGPQVKRPCSTVVYSNISLKEGLSVPPGKLWWRWWVAAGNPWILEKKFPSWIWWAAWATFRENFCSKGIRQENLNPSFSWHKRTQQPPCFLSQVILQVTEQPLPGQLFWLPGQETLLFFGAIIRVRVSEAFCQDYMML